VHKVEHLQIMQQNMQFIEAISHFRREVQNLDAKLKANKTKI
jgi:hypothetical protein